jgi:hypothetical protein
VSAWFWQVPAAAAVPAAMYGLCWANDRGYNVERLFKGWTFAVVVIAYMGWVFWRDEGPLAVILAVAGLMFIALGVALHLRRQGRRLRLCEAECGRMLPPSKFEPGALNCKDCVAVRLMSDDIMRARRYHALVMGGPDAVIAMLDDSKAQWASATQEAKQRLGVEEAW